MFSRLSTKLTVFILLAILPIMVIAFYLSYQYATQFLISDAKRDAKLILENAEYQIILHTQPIEDTSLRIVDNLPDSIKGFQSSFSSALEEDSDIFSVGLIFEPHTFLARPEHHRILSYREAESIEHLHLSIASNKLQESPSYEIAKVQREPLWHEPSPFEKADNLITSYSHPIYRDAEYYGLLTLGISHKTISKIISEISAFETGYVFLLSASGKLMTHPDWQTANQSQIPHHASLNAITNAVNHPKLTPQQSTIENRDNLILFKKINTGWTLVAVFPKAELFAPVFRLSYILIFLGLISTILVICAIVFFTRKLTTGMHQLSQQTLSIAEGNFMTPIPAYQGRDELSRLSTAFESMRLSLLDYIDNLKRTENQKQKIESELSIAKQIQQDMLPQMALTDLQKQKIAIFATMTPARVVGGDFYDFYFLDADTFVFAVGDVSGKGVPAALFMAVSKTLLEAVTDKNMTAGEILTKANQELAERNENCMFVTVFMGIINLKTGRMMYANSGHNPPLLLSNGETAQLDSPIRPPLGAFEQISYPTQHVSLLASDKLFVYTDGVTEAVNADDSQYSETRLQEKLANLQQYSPEHIITAIAESLTSFTQGVAQHDDITMLCLSTKKASI